MSITPIQKIDSLEQIAGAQKSVLGSQKTENDGLSFKSIFTDAINDVKETNEVLQNEAYKLATGQTDNLHDITIASTKASLSVELFVQLRNKALDSYKELMNMGI